MIKRNLLLALADIRDGIASIYIWPMLGWLEIKQRYRRSLLGPLWLTLSTGIMIGGMGPLYGRLLKQDVGGYFGYLAVSFVVWMFFSNLINESCNVFIAAEGYIKQIKLPLTIHVLRNIWKNFIIFAHNFIIVVVVLFFFPPATLVYLLLIPVALIIVAANALWLGILLGLICARYRDVPLIVASLVQVLFFLTPVLWQADMLERNKWVADINPLFHFIEIIRAPILGHAPTEFTWMVVLGTTIVGIIFSLAMFSRFRCRIAYWV